MIKKALKSAAGISIGCMIGGCLLPRLLFSESYSASYPPVWLQALLCFAVGFTASFLVLLLFSLISSGFKKI